MFAALSLAGVFAKAKSIVTSKWFILAAVCLAAGGGVYWYLNKTQDAIVEAKVENHDLQASNKTYQTSERVRNAADKVDERYDRIADQTREDYFNVRQDVYEAPVDQRTAPAPTLIIDTLNNLDRVRQQREGASSGVPDPEVPVG